VVRSDEGSPRVRFLGSGGVEVVRRMADSGRGGLRLDAGDVPCGARDRSTGCRLGEVGVEETKERRQAQQGLKCDDDPVSMPDRALLCATPHWCVRTAERTGEHDEGNARGVLASLPLSAREPEDRE
jgi:hypothetical protein